MNLVLLISRNRNVSKLSRSDERHKCFAVWNNGLTRIGQTNGAFGEGLCNDITVYTTVNSQFQHILYLLTVPLLPPLSERLLIPPSISLTSLQALELMSLFGTESAPA